MKLVYLHQYFCFPDQSGGTRSYDLAKKFAQQGVQVEVITSTMSAEGGDTKWTVLERDGIRVHTTHLPYNNRMSFFQRKIVFAKFSWRATFKILSIRCDLVLATSTPLTIGIPALIKKFIAGTPYIFEVRDVWPEAVVAIGAIKSKLVICALQALERLIYRNAAAVVALSTDMRASIVRRCSFLRTTDVDVIENISEIDRFDVDSTPTKPLLTKKLGFTPRFTVLYAGAFGRVNGLRYAVDLAKRCLVLDPGITFVLIGNGVEKEEVANYARTCGVLGNNLFILDSVTKNELPLIYSECDIGSSFVLNIPELWANSANKFFDSLAAGLPVLINYGGWQKQVISSNQIGFAFSPDAAEITESDLEALVRYSENKDLQELSRDRARSVARKNYSLCQASGRYMEILRRVQ